MHHLTDEVRRMALVTDSVKQHVPGLDVPTGVTLARVHWTPRPNLADLANDEEEEKNKESELIFVEKKNENDFVHDNFEIKIKNENFIENDEENLSSKLNEIEEQKKLNEKKIK